MMSCEGKYIVMGCVAASFLGLVFVTVASAEDKLVKGQASYLGWAQPEKLFRTCSGNVIPVDDGKIVPAKDTCTVPNSGKGILRPFVFKGVVEDINSDDKTITVRANEGRVEKFYYSPSASVSGQDNSFDLNRSQKIIGQKIMVTGSMSGRADSIVTAVDK